MRTWTGLLLCLVLAGCASAPLSVPPREGLFQDQLFAAPSQRVSADDVFALSDAMTRYLKTRSSTAPGRFTVSSCARKTSRPPRC